VTLILNQRRDRDQISAAIATSISVAPDATAGSSTCAIFCGTLFGMTTTIEELMTSAIDARRVAQNAIRVAVREARAADWSWDRISAALGGSPNGETLRRNFGGEE
jgi:hypothetical protein